MGTRYTVALVAGADLGLLPAAVHAAVDQVDRQMSTWKPDSDLMRFNAAPVGEWVAVPADLAFVVTEGLKIARDSRGAFDMTVGAAVNAWGFGPPPADPLAVADPSPGPDRLEARLAPPALRKASAFSLDLSGIAKGFGVDRIAAVLERHGVTDYLVTLDGEIRARGRKPGLDGAWTLALEAPLPGRHEAWDILQPRDIALATSGDYRHFRQTGGETVSHTIDPRSGRPIPLGLTSVTVADASCMRADALATVLMVLGPTEAPAWAEARQIPALLLLRDGDGLREVRTGAFAELCLG